MKGYLLWLALESLDRQKIIVDDWHQIGRALLNEGYPCEVWDEWSKDLPWYRAGLCETCWEEFKRHVNWGCANTIFRMAMDRGWKFSNNVEEE